MIKLLVISLEEPEQEIYDKIIEIVNGAHISIDETIEGKQGKMLRLTSTNTGRKLTTTP